MVVRRHARERGLLFCDGLENDNRDKSKTRKRKKEKKRKRECRSPRIVYVATVVVQVYTRAPQASDGNTNKLQYPLDSETDVGGLCLTPPLRNEQQWHPKVVTPILNSTLRQSHRHA